MHMYVVGSFPDHIPVHVNVPYSICSEGMSRDLSGEVEKVLKSSNPYIVRKVQLYVYMYTHVTLYLWPVVQRRGLLCR